MIFMHAAIPSKPTKVTGTIQKIQFSLTNISAIASVSWFPPANQDKTVIDYYELVLSTSDTKNTTFKVPADAFLSYHVKVPEGKYSASVRAVDVCGQKSEFSQTVLNVTSAFLFLQTVDEAEKQQQQKIDGLSSAFAITLIILIILVVTAVIVICFITKRQQNDHNQIDEQNKGKYKVREPRGEGEQQGEGKQREEGEQQEESEQQLEGEGG